MASSLTSASLKSGFLYLIFFASIILGVIYLLFFQQPSAINNLNRQAFRLNYVAFKNGIELANYRFIASQQTNNQSGFLDIWNDGISGLDYNQAGFPIGVDITNTNQKGPLSAQNCLQLWQFVLGPLKPTISITQNSGDYWVELNLNDICIYRSNKIHDLIISYSAGEGKVVINTIN